MTDPVLPHDHPAHHLSSTADLVRQLSNPLDPRVVNGPAMLMSETVGHSGPSSSAGKNPAGPSTPPTKDQHSSLVFAFSRRERPLPSPRHLKWMLLAVFFVMILAGWNDASAGPLLPSLQAYWHINYLEISTIWIGNFVGFMTSGVTNVALTDRFGFGLVAPFGALAQALGFVMMSTGGPFPVFVIGYVINGFGLGLQDAQVNALVSRMPNPGPKMFLLHAVYGLGATISPIITTEFVKRVPKVYLFFVVSVGLAIMTATLLIVVFKGRTIEQVVGSNMDDEPAVDPPAVEDPEKAGEVPDRSMELTATTDTVCETPTGESPAPSAEKERARPASSGNKMKQILRMPTVHLIAFYLLLYVGYEVTIGGWATSFILDERGGNSNSGYVSVGYFGGLTLGRVVLIPLTDWMGKYNSLYVYTTIAIALEIVIWFTHSIVGNAVCFALVGFFLGPMYPIMMMVVLDVIPPELQGGVIGWVASLGQAGSAILPFATGAMSEAHGVWVLQPFIIALMAASMLLFALIKRPKGWRV